MAKLVVAPTILLLFMTFSSLCKSTRHGEKSEVMGMFVFGSSLVDNGNNNFLNNSGVRADYLPYGVDFPLGPSGRFSNGRNVIDALGELLRLPGLVPPFADPATTRPRVVHGVNFASGGSGILDETGLVTGEVMSLKQQISNFEAVTLPDLRSQLGAASNNNKQLFDQNYLSNYLFVIGTGGNDYLLNYFRPRSSTGGPSLSEFTHTLITRFSHHLQRLYVLGARKFVIFSVQPIGCTPVVRAYLNITDASCAVPANEAALLFNSNLKSLVDGAKSQMPGVSIVYVNSYKITKDIIEYPTKSGFVDTTRPCCEMSRMTSDASVGVLCKRKGRVCSDRTKYVFFDGLHPTDAVNVRIAHKGFRSRSAQEAYPINVKELAVL